MRFKGVFHDKSGKPDIEYLFVEIDAILLDNLLLIHQATVGIDGSLVLVNGVRTSVRKPVRPHTHQKQTNGRLCGPGGSL